VSEEEDEGTENGRTLAEVIKSKKEKTSQEGGSSHGGELLPSYSSIKRVTTQKRKASVSPGGDEEETPM
jgi:hypothetical protein